MDPIGLLAGAVVGADVSALLTEVIVATKKAFRCKDYCKNLCYTLESIQPLVSKVTQSSEKGDATCQDWLANLQALLMEAKDLVFKCGTESGLFKSIRFVYVNKKRLSSSLIGIDNRIKGIVGEASLLTLDVAQQIRTILCTWQSMVSGDVGKLPGFEVQLVPSIIVAFERNPFKKLKELIMCAADAPLGEALTVGLKAGGGAGKTLLAKMVNNDEDIQEKYGAGSILWITVGHDASVSSIYKTMGQYLNDNGAFERSYAHRNPEDQRTYLMEAFKVKRILLILDDVWGNSYNNHAMIYWVGICNGCGSTTLITTRNGTVLDEAKAKERVDVLSLSKEESWKLFCYHAFESSIPTCSSEFENIARGVCEECKGLPLALEVIGRALSEKKDEKGWKIALSRLVQAKSMCNLKSVDNELFFRLKFSYDELDEETKRCFLYFAAFPEDDLISTKQLCSIWHAEESFNTYNDDDDEDKSNMGWMNLVALADRSLIYLDEDGKYARMHDVLRDLAIRILREAKVGDWAFECHFEPGKVLKSFPRIKEIIKRLSFVGSTFEHVEAPEVNIPVLEVCILSRVSMLNDNGICIPFEFSSSMSKLVHLDLVMCRDFDELPKSIKELKSIVHLDLSNCYDLKELRESIKELKSLVHLDLSWCYNLKELPESIKELKSLVHLDLSWCGNLKELPEGITELKSLVHLDLSGCRYLKELPESIKELKSLVHLDLSWCGNLKELPEGIKELKSLVHLDLSWCGNLKELPESITELKSLVHLDLSWCPNLKELPEGIKELKSLVHLNLFGCESLKELPKSIKELKYLVH